MARLQGLHRSGHRTGGQSRPEMTKGSEAKTSLIMSAMTWPGLVARSDGILFRLMPRRNGVTSTAHRILLCNGRGDTRSMQHPIVRDGREVWMKSEALKAVGPIRKGQAGKDLNVEC